MPRYRDVVRAGSRLLPCRTQTEKRRPVRRVARIATRCSSSWSASARPWRWRSSRLPPRRPSLRGADPLGAAAAVGLRLQYPDLASWRWPSARWPACRSASPSSRASRLVRIAAARRHAALPQLALAGAAVPVHVPDPLRDPRLRPAHPVPRLGQGDPGLRAAGDGQHVRDRARRHPVDRHGTMGRRAGARAHPPAVASTSSSCRSA